MAKGALAKEQIFNKMMEVFEGSFMYNNGKELRINWEEDGNPVQIKVALTCAKEMVGDGFEVKGNAAAATETVPIKSVENISTPVEPTLEEKQNVEDLLTALGLN